MSEDRLTQALGIAGERLTRPRAAVAEMVALRRGPFTARDLVGEAERRRRPVGRATIFRTLELLAQLGLLERIDLLDGSHAYVRCRPSHHHHVVCSRCGRTVEIPDFGLGAVTDEVARQTGFGIQGHRLEIFGRCPECQAASGRSDVAGEETRPAGRRDTAERARQGG